MRHVLFAWASRRARETNALRTTSSKLDGLKFTKMNQLRTLLAVILLSSLAGALAQPANDLFANRFVVSGTFVSTNGTTVGATPREAGEPAPFQFGAGQSQQTVWYEWTPVASIATTLSISGSYRETIAVFTGGAVNTLSQVSAAAAAAGGTTASLNFNAIAGTAYKIQVGGRGTASGTFSLVVSQQVAGPLVSLTSPANGQSFTNPVNVTLSATVSKPLGGTVTNVSFFYQATNLIATLTSSPYTFVWNNPPVGTYPVVARATDDSARVGSSANANITVRPPGFFSISLVGSNGIGGTNSFWKYKDDGSDQGTAWQLWGFDDSSWPSGPGQFGYSTNAPENDEATVVSYGPDPLNKYITTYFRHSFTVNNAAAITNLIARVQRDDGVAVYLNGVEVMRNNLAPAADYVTLAGNAQDDGVTFFPTNINPALLTNGLNVLAAEIHQVLPDSSDLSFYLALDGEGAGAVPAVAITSPTNNAPFFAPASITINATASDSDGTVTNVEFFADGVKLGQDTTAPYSFVWNSPPIGAHILRVTATDNGGATGSDQISIVVYDASGTPLVQITNPTNNSTFAAPVDISVSASANAPNGVTNVDFYANSGGAGLGTRIGSDTTAPYTLMWSNVLAGNYGLRAVVFSASNVRATSAVVNITVTNTPPPTIAGQLPPPGTVQTLTSVQVTFSKPVTGVDAADFRVNGAPATQLSTLNPQQYTFTFPEPPFGAVAITWASAHGIQDLAGQPFNTNSPGSMWSYNLADTTPPTITARTPAAGAVVTNLTQVTVNFSENVNGVNAGDILINGSPASGLAVNSGSNYTFNFAPPTPGTVNITWISSHGIVDTSPSANAFDHAAPGATWSCTLATPATILVPSNTVWRFVPGTNEASPSDITAWRQLAFDDSSWSNSATPFNYSTPYTDTYTNALTGPGTYLSDMQGLYQCIYLRIPFLLTSPSSVSNFIYRHQSDDGFVAWINGTEVLRVNMGGAPTDPPFQSGGVGNANEPFQNGAQYIFETNTLGLANLVPGTNILAVQAFNANLAQSSDFGFNLQFEATIIDTDPSNTPPRIASVSPGAGDIFTFTSLLVRFNEPVTGVNASDLLINGTPATGLSGTGSNFTFTFPQPPYGPVAVTWAASHGIADFDAPPKPFNATAPGSTFNYALINPSAPTIASQTPLAASTVNGLTQVQVTFSETVQGVNASDLLVNGLAATQVAGSGANYTFTFPQPAYGNVAISWANSGGVQTHNIRDTEAAQNAFDATRPGATWSYTLLDQTPPTVASQNPIAGANVTNLTSLTVTFSEAVQGVNAADLVINGVPANSVNPVNSVQYTFTFAQPNTSVVNIGWAGNHAISDLAPSPNAFNATGPGATWQYFTPDNVPPDVANTSPTPFSTVRTLAQLTLTFTEPVTGVNASDLLINGAPAQNVSGSAAGPYTFQFTQPPTGSVAIAWAAGHAITDLASPPNPFAGGAWSYVLDPNAIFADKIVINEIFFHPTTERTNEEWIELHNVDTVSVNLTGWQLTQGANFTFPNVSIPAGGYLVVAANVPAFQAKYPGVNNVVGGWAGQLSNTDEDIQLETATGEEVDTVHYADEGDWAIRQRGPLEGGSRGWEWFSAADGTNFNTASGLMEGGRSLELRNPALPNQHGQNWAFSTQTNGTPGAANTALSTNIAPLVLDVAHFPAVPTSTDPVTITTRIRDEQTNGLTVTLFQRNHSTLAPPAFSAVTMFDDGAHNDGLLNDGVFGVILPAQPNGTVIEYYVQAVDPFQGGTSRTNTWPAPARQVNGTFAQTANALYQVDNEVYTGSQPVYRTIMTETERVEFQNINRQSDAEMNCTFISIDGEGTKVRHNCGVRIRGAGSRGANPPNNRVNIPTDRRWNGLSEINLNSQYTHVQTLGSALSLKSGLPAAFARAVQYRVNGANPANSGPPQFGSYAFVEAINGEWAQNHYPNDGNGNVYRGSRAPWSANLSYQGTNFQTYMNLGYSKTSNQSENDWTDLFNLTLALNNTNAADSVYVQGVTSNANVTLFMRFFAVCSLMSYQETSLCRGVGDDYAMYRGVADPRFTAVPHDFDTILNQGDTAGVIGESIFQPILTPESGSTLEHAMFLQRFMRHPEFVPIYFSELKRLAESVFAPTNLSPLADQLLGDWAASSTLPAIKNFNASRTASVLSQIPLTYSSTLNPQLPTSNGVPYTTAATLSLRGTANAIDTRVVRVNGAASTYSAWEGRWTNNAVALQPGLNNLLVEAVGSNNVVWSTNIVVWYDTGAFTTVGGTLSANTTWSAGAGPYRLTANVTVANGVTLTIQPGTTVYFNPGVGLTVANGGRLLAEGNAFSRIQFSIVPGPSNRWSGITINGAAGSPESRITHAHIEGNSGNAVGVTGGDAFLDHLTFGTTDRRYINLDAASFIVSHCVFPPTTGSFEPVHGAGGIRTGGRGIFLRNFFGRITGYNDTVDFTGGNRPGPIVQFINNVFMGSDDDLLDLDGTDAWVEGNIFLHAHRNGSPDSSSGVSGGNDSGQTSEITVIGNIFYDVDQAATAKQGNFYTFINNTVVHQSGVGSQDAGVTAVLNFADDGIALANGMYVEGNIIVDAERLTRNLTNGTPLGNNTTFNNNLMPFSYGGPGTNNSTANPLLKYLPQLAETSFTSWEQAQVMRDWFSLQSGSPARGSGPNGRDKGGVVPLGVSISGEPGGSASAPAPLNSATLRVGVNRTGNGIPAGAAAFPNGSGYTHYRWRLDGGAWSAETPTATPISLNGLAPGPHQVDVAGKRDANFYQDDAAYGSDALITSSRTWFVNTNASVVRINEILAANNGVFVHSNTTPDAVELFNASASAVDLEGLRLTDDPADPDKFIFPPGTVLPANGYLVVFADSANTPGLHLDFTLSAEGEALYLYDSVLRGGALLDSRTFGLQLQNLSVGHLPVSQLSTLNPQLTWALCVPTLGSANIAAATGDPLHLKINEWLASGLSLSPNDFVELFNQDPLPVALGGLFLTDEPMGWPNRHEIAALSFIAGGGYRSFIADADANDGADHLNFSLTPEQGLIGLMRGSGAQGTDAPYLAIDCVVYGPQRVDISQGRSPNGSSNIVFFAQPTPGAPNQSVLNTNTGIVINEVFASNASYPEADGSTPDWIEFHNLSGSAVDISDMSFTDSTLTPRRYVFAPGTVIGALGYLRLRCDADLPVSTTNAGFGISATGGGVFLFDKLSNGGSLINAVSYGLQAVDFAIGRVPNGTGSFVLTVPTAGAANNAASLGNVSLLKINEWMAQPNSGDDWFEIYNPNVQPVSVGGLFLSDNLANRTKSPIPALSFIGGGTNGWQRFWADSNPGAGADHANFALGAGGEALALSTSASASIDSLTFPAQQTGVSEGRFPDGNATIVRFPGTASPGDANYLLLPNIVINEALSHTDLPFEDAIELRNLSGVATNIGNWWLSDAKNTLRKYRIPAGTILPANGYRVFYEYQFNFDTNDPAAFSLSSGNGDQIYLSAADTNGTLTGYRASVEFGAAENAVSFGRYVTSDNRAEFVAMSAMSFGQDGAGNVAQFRTGTGLANPYPKVGPVVIAQIQYRPPDIGTNDNTLDEFIELRNTGGSAVNLFNTTNSWRLRDAVDFDFPPGVSMPAGGRLLVVSFDPVASPGQLAAFRMTYSVDATVPIFGPYSGKLANNDDNVELYKPDAPNNNDVPYILVEQVHYFDLAPWPPAADGTGAALRRVSLSGFGNDPTNWVAAVPNFGGGGDSDGDGMPDAWENQYGLNPTNAADANFDLDGDGMTNRQEYIAGTDPTQKNSALRIISVENVGANSARLTFLAVSNRTYAVEFKNALTDPSWSPLTSISAAPTNRTMLINTTVPGTNRFYRLRTP